MQQNVCLAQTRGQGLQPHRLSVFPGLRKPRPFLQKCSFKENISVLPQQQNANIQHELQDDHETVLQQRIQTTKQQEMQLRKEVQELELELFRKKQSKQRTQLNLERGFSSEVVKQQQQQTEQVQSQSASKSRKRRKKRSSQFSSARAQLNGDISDNGNGNENENVALQNSGVVLAPASQAVDSTTMKIQEQSAASDEETTIISNDVTTSEDSVEASTNESCVLAKPIFVVSDCTGESAAHTVRAALGQFELCYQLSCPANMVVFRFQENQDSLYEIAHKAQQEDALIVYTLVDPVMVKAIKTAAKLYDVKAVDLWSNLLDNMESHLDAVRSGLPFMSPKRRTELPADYFRMIEAVEYTRKMDDGANPHNWHDADLLILGVSRSGKTPLSIYMGQRGYKVANLPLVQNCPIPRQLYEIDQRKIIGLLIDPSVLCQIRTTRKGVMGVEKDEMDYDDIRKVRSEVQWAKKLYSQNPDWLVLDVTLRSVEETAARILKSMSDRLGTTHPLWS